MGELRGCESMWFSIENVDRSFRNLQSRFVNPQLNTLSLIHVNPALSLLILIVMYCILNERTRAWNCSLAYCRNFSHSEQYRETISKIIKRQWWIWTDVTSLYNDRIHILNWRTSTIMDKEGTVQEANPLYTGYRILNMVAFHSSVCSQIEYRKKITREWSPRNHTDSNR